MGRLRAVGRGAAVVWLLMGGLGLRAMPVAAAELGELSLKEREGRFVVHRSDKPIDDERFLYLLEWKRADYNFTYSARRTQESLNLVHWGGTALGTWFAFLGYSLISRGVRLQAASYPDNPELMDASASNGRYDYSLGLQFAVASVVCLANWFYQPRAFDLGAAQEAIEAYNRQLKSELPPSPEGTSTPWGPAVTTPTATP